MTRGQLVSVFFIALLLFIAFQILWILQPFWVPIFWASILAFGFYPLHQRLRQWLKTSETLGALATTLIVVLVLVPPAVFFVAGLAAEAVKFYNYIQEGRHEAWLEQIRATPFVQQIEFRFPDWEIAVERLKEWIAYLGSTIADLAARKAGVITKNVILVPLNFFLVFFMMFFFLRDGGRIYRFIYEITPMEEENKKPVFGQIQETMSAVLRGQILTAFAQAGAAGIVFTALGLPLPIFFAAATFLAALIPVVGAPAVWLPFVFYLLAQQDYLKAGILFLLGVFGISLIDNFLKPILIGEKTKLPYLLLFLGILGGVQAYGFVGIFLAPAVISVFFVLVKIYREKFL